MNLLLPPRALAEERGTVWAWPAPVVAAAFDAGGQLAFGLGDGTVRLASPDRPEAVAVPAHRGAVLALAPDVGGGFLNGRQIAAECAALGLAMDRPSSGHIPPALKHLVLRRLQPGRR